MDGHSLSLLARLTDQELLARTRGLFHRERLATAELVAHLAEVHRRRGALAAGYPSLFAYCRDGLGMSDDEAYNRTVVAEAACRCPALLEALAEGDVSLTAVRLVAPHLTDDNAATVLRSIRGRRRSEVEQVVAALAPRPDAKSLLRRLPAPPDPVPAAAPALAGDAARPVAPPGPPLSVPQPPAPVPGPTLAPTSPGRFRLQVTLDAGTADLLRELKDLLRHAVPSGDEAEIVRRALSLLHAEVHKQRFAAVARPRPHVPATASDGIPAEVRRQVWARDEGRCAFRSQAGQRCGERAFVEFHHRHPKALGGPPTVGNIALRCRAHNAYEAEVDYGRLPRVVPTAVPERGPALPRGGASHGAVQTPSSRAVG